MRPVHRPRRAVPPATEGETPILAADVLAQFTDAVVVLDGEQRVVLFNQAAEELTGLPQSRVLGQPCRPAFASMPVLADMAERVLRDGQSEARGEEHLQRRGRPVPVRVTCLPLWGGQDCPTGAALVIHDLSQQKTLEESARRNESLARLGTLVAGLAHEVRNPLAGIKGAAQLLESRLAADPAIAEYTRVITREVDRLSALVEDLLTLGSPPKPRLEPVNVHRVIQHVVRLARPELDRRHIRLRCEFDPSLPNVQADEAQLSQVLLNLLKNAMDAATAAADARPERDSIRIATRMETDFRLREMDRASKFLRIEIADQGVGIAPADVARLFEPFFTTKPRGTGLGLAISHRIVAEHGGLLRIVANRPYGTVVTVILPVAND